ncbi:MAG: hypothetical protein ACYS76_04190 [Planctomycetota bacterium]
MTMWTYWKGFWATTFCLMVIAFTAAAAQQEHGEHEQARHYHINMAEIFLGGTYEDAEHGSENGFTVGFTYERRLNELLGVGGFYEYAAGDFDKWSVGAPLFIHPHEGWRFALAPGLEHRDGDDEFLFRTGVGYEFKLSERWVMIPEFNVDFVDGEEAYVFGVSFGFGF